MSLRGVVNLQKFVEDGGLFILITNCARVAIDYGIVEGVAIQDTRQLQARGSVYNATFADRRSSIAYGYAETLPIYFNQAPVLQVAAGGSPVVEDRVAEAKAVGQVAAPDRQVEGR